MPGVSTRMTWDLPISAMPRTGPRVVCALWVTMETLAPTSALVRVDLPLFGAPINATKPPRVCSPWGGGARALGIWGRLPHPFAQQQGERSGLLGGLLVSPLPALRRHALDLNLGGKAGRMVGAFAGDFEIARQGQAPPLRPFLQQGFRVGRGKFEHAKLRLPESPHQGLGRLVAAIGEDGAQNRLARISEDGLLAASAAAGLAAAHQDEVAEVPLLCNLGAGLGPHEGIEPARQLALVRLGEAIGQELCDSEPQHAGAEELKTLIFLVGVCARPRARMRQGKLEQRRVEEVVPKPGGEILKRRCARLRQ